jgi:hypothetical protein
VWHSAAYSRLAVTFIRLAARGLPGDDVTALPAELMYFWYFNPTGLP